MAPADGERSLRAGPVGGRIAEPPLIGRADELTALQELLASARERVGCCVLLAGEPGIGKSRLARELQKIAQQEGFLCLSARADPSRPEFSSINELIQEFQRNPRHPAVEPPPQPAEGGSSPVGPGPPQGRSDRFELFEAVTQFFVAVSRESPLLLYIDDLRHADAATAAFLEHLVRRAQQEQIVVLGCYRDTELLPDSHLSGLIDALGRDHLLVLITLGRHTERQTGEMVAAMLSAPRVPEEAAARIYQESRGNPYFTEEIVRSLEAQGLLQQQDGEWPISHLDRLLLPESVRASIMLRFNRLSLGCRDLLQLAAVIGRSRREVLEAAAREDPGWETALAEATASGLLLVDWASDEFRLYHPLVRDVIYDGLWPGRRKALHARVARTLAAKPELGDGWPGCLAYHLLEAGNDEEALGHLLAEVREEKWDCTPEYRFQLCERGLAALDRLPDTPEHRAARRTLLETQMRVGEVLHESTRLLAVCEAWLECARPFADPAAAAAAHLRYGCALVACARWDEALSELSQATQAESISDRASAWTQIAGVWSSRGRPDQALEADYRAVETTQAGQDAVSLARALTRLAGDAQMSGDWQQALDALERAAALPLQPLDRVAVLDRLVQIYAQLGDFARAADLMGELLSLSRALRPSQPVSVWRERLLAAGALYHQIGDQDRALSLLQDNYSVGTGGDDQMLQANALVWLARVWLARGEVNRALEANHRAARIIHPNGNTYWRCQMLKDTSRLWNDAGDHARAIDEAQYIVEHAHAGGMQELQAMALRVLAQAHLSRGEVEEALIAGRASLAIEQSTGGFTGAFMSHSLIGQTLDAMGRTEEAISSFHNAVSYLERLRASLRREEHQRGLLRWAHRRAPYEALARLLPAVGRPEEARPYQERLAQLSSPAATPLVPGLEALPATGPLPIVIRMLGGFGVVLGEESVPSRAWRLRKAGGVFKFLLLQPERTAPREVLLETFWPHLEPDRAQNNLHVSLHALRRTLEPRLPPGAGSSYLLFEGGCYLLNPHVSWWIDVDEFEAQIAAAEVAEKDGDMSLAASRYEGALRLYAGDLLPEDTYEDWCAGRRERLRASAVRALAFLTDRAIEQREYGEAEGLAQQLLNIDGCFESAYRVQMTIHAARGNRAAVAAQYRRCYRALRQELGVAPSAETVQLYRALTDDRE
jgi:DNA-binding SARP family transcriptional activator